MWPELSDAWWSTREAHTGFKRVRQRKMFNVSSAFTPTGSVQRVNRKSVALAFFEIWFEHRMI